MFFSFDGIDGVGKSTQLKLFCDWLRDQGHEVVTCRDPGGTPTGEAIRELLLHRHDLAIGRAAEMFLYMAARSQLVEQVIQPALAAGKTVVGDRFLLANVVYQGYGGGLDVEALWQIGATATRGLWPDLTFVLDMSVAAARARIQRSQDRMEQHDDAFFQRLRDGFLTEAQNRADRIVVIPAERDIDAIQTDIRAAAQRVLDARKGAKR